MLPVTMIASTTSASSREKVCRVDEEDMGEPGPVAAPDEPNIDTLAK